MSMPSPTSSQGTASEHSLEPSAQGDILHLLDSPEALELYLAHVKQRREANRQQRRRVYWQTAVERLHDELQAAENEPDAEIAAELKAVICWFEDALVAADAPVVSITSSNAECTTVEKVPLHLPPNEPLVYESIPVASDEISTIPAQEQAYLNGTQALPREQVPDEYAQGITAASVEPIVDEAACQSLIEAAEELQEKIVAQLAAVGDDLPYAIRMRALFCEGQALIHDPNIPGKEGQRLANILDDLATARTPWPGDCPFALTENSREIWDTLCHLYETCAAAGDAMGWYWENEEALSEHTRIDLLNAVAAAQQQLYRNVERLRRRDEVVLELYRQIRSAGQGTGFLRALSADMTNDELSELSARGERIFCDARLEVEEQRAQAERGLRKDAAIATVIAWDEALEGRAVTSESLDADRKQLCALLDDCLTAGVPPTNVKVRSAILDTAPVLLADQAKYSKFLDAVLAERVRRGLDTVEVVPSQAEVRDENLDMLIKSVVEFTRGRRVVMLGGKSRSQVAQELQELLECEVSWPDSDRGDKFGKFSSTLKKADVVLLLKNFASHELFHGSKDAMAANGKHFVVLPSGYGVKQVLYQLSLYAAKEKVSA